MTQSEIIRLLHPKLMEFIFENFRDGLTEIQIQAIPTILNGEDCIIEAPTAGGKTEAVFIPLFHESFPKQSTRYPGTVFGTTSCIT